MLNKTPSSALHAPLLSSADAARYIGIKPGTLAIWRSKRINHIDYISVGHLVKYHKSTLDAYLRSNLKTH